MESSGFEFWDYVVIVGYFIAMIFVAIWSNRKQSNTSDFFMAGRGMAWWPIAISLFAALFSAISYIAMPGEAYNYGMNMFLACFVRLLPMPIMIVVFLRLFYSLKLWTAYEYLELRFDVKARLLGSILFLLFRGVYLGVVLYATSLVIHPAVGWSPSKIVLIVGIASTIYTAIGGLKAVIWTDVLQFFVLLGGIVLVIIDIAFQVDGGVVGIWHEAEKLHRGFNVGAGSGFWDFNFKERITVWVWLVAIIPACISPAIEQMTLQLCLSGKTFRQTVLAVLGNAVGSIPVIFLFYFAGLAVLVYFKKNGLDHLPVAARGDDAFTWYLANKLPIGVRGVLVAAILAAVISTINSTINALSAVSMKDCYQRVLRPGKTEKHYLVVSRYLTFFWGGISIFIALAIIKLFASKNVPLLEASAIALGEFGALVLGMFSLGLLTRRANTIGAFAGIIAGATVSVSVLWFAYLKPAPEDRMSFMWLGFISIFTVFIVGYLSSLPFPKRNISEISKYVVWYKTHKNR